MLRTSRLLSLHVWTCIVATLLASAGSANAQTTALYFDSHPGDYIGHNSSDDITQRVERTYLPSDGTFTILTPTTSSPNFLRVTVIGPSHSFWWYLEFSNANGAPLTPGSYGSVQARATTANPGLSVTGNGRGCGHVRGRFLIRELVIGAGNAITAFAADFEQHCGDQAHALYGAIRYNSSVSDMAPFGGAYPVYQLSLAQDPHGRVTGIGIDCGAGHATCTLAPSAATEVTLTATPEPDYVFTGWSGDCRGLATTTVRINTIKTCTARFEPFATSTSRSMLHWVSEPGDVIGRGEERLMSPPNSEWNVYSYEGGRSVHFSISDEFGRANLSFYAPEGQTLVPGTYEAARRGPFTPFNGLDISADSLGCNRLTGRFVVHEVSIAIDGTVQRFAADFEQHCDDAVPALIGIIRYNSTTDPVVPFGGVYPLYQLTVGPSPHGRVTGNGVSCGSGAAACQVTQSTAYQLTLTATPDPGYIFMGWVGDCQGGFTSLVHVNGPKSCEALFHPAVTSSPRTVMYWDNRAGPSIRAGAVGVYSLANSRWTVSGSDNQRGVSIRIRDASDSWSLNLSGSAGQPLAVGEYTAVREYAGSIFNGFSTSVSGGGCSRPTGRFIVREIVFGSGGSVQRLAVDLEQHCDDAVPGFFAAIRYNATIDEVVPFGGAYPSYQVTLSAPSNGRLTGPGLNCGGGFSACQSTLGAAAHVALRAVPDPGYTFMGWLDDCSGGTNTTLHVNAPKRCSARFELSAITAPRTLMRWDSDAGHPVARGRSEVNSLANSVWTAFPRQGGNGIDVSMRSVGPLSEVRWSFNLLAPGGEILQAGRTYRGRGFVDGVGMPGLSVSGTGVSCNGGEFTIRELVFGAQSAVVRLAFDFISNCGVSSGPMLVGSVQYNSLVEVPTTTLVVEPSSLRFGAVHNGAAVTTQPAAQTVRLLVSGSSTTWSAAASEPWVQLSPASGSGSTSMSIGVNLLGMPPGGVSPTAAVTVTLNEGSGATRTINLRVTLHFNGTTSPPFGFVDTPVQNSTGVTGAIPMTGWALDDLEIASLTICRAAVGAETPIADGNCGGAAQIFVGTGAFIEGARPDVQAAYPNHPRADRGGWGFMLLTNMLPNRGTGTFVFYVYARDREGHVVLLGTRTMTCDNAHATAPFGAIDTPAQGDTASGTGYLNFGWVLTPNPKSIPADGSTLMVYVDGVAVGRPTYNNYRADIATLFPGLANSNGAVGYRVLDTSLLPNGLHTIVWTATDSAGITSGIGSRYFRVANGVAASMVETAGASDALTTTAGAVDAVAPDASAIVGRRGWSADAAWVQYAVGRSGRAVVRGEEIDRFELALGARTDETYTGYLRVGERLQPLPIGSRLDPTTGSFAWAPGVGFVGVYDLVFVRSRDGAAVGRHEVRVVIQPRGSDRVGAPVVIDTPRSQQDLAQPFLLGGWAVDRGAAAGTGVDAVHVWAHPLTGGAPVFLGAAAIGGTRPDVAAVLGDQFRDAGYNLTVQGLEPGNYDLAVFAWSRVTNGFVPAQVVRVTAR
jgi:hypothetical protein